jgi:phospholipase/carboxylesterase
VTNPHLETEPVVLGPAPEEVTGTAVLVHGRGSGPETMLGVAGPLARRGVRCVVPAAAGGTWYPQRFTAPVAANEPWLTYALEALDALVGDDTSLIGFSQGACLVLEYVARHPRSYRAVAGLSGGLIGTGGELTRPQGLDGTPVLITTAQDDDWVPVERTRESAEILAAGGAQVDLRVFGPGAHAIRAEEADAVAALVLR